MPFRMNVRDVREQEPHAAAVRPLPARGRSTRDLIRGRQARRLVPVPSRRESDPVVKYLFAILFACLVIAGVVTFGAVKG